MPHVPAAGDALPPGGWRLAQAQAERGPVALPSLGDAGQMMPGEERALGDVVARMMYRDPAYLDDAILGEYVDGLWQRLLAAARQRGDLPPELDGRYAWRVLLGREAEINAFAVPGGYFGLNLGLIGVTRRDDELASVLAHELSHVTQRHIARSMEQQARQTPLVLAAMVLGVLAAGKNGDMGQAVIAGTSALAVRQQLGYSRGMEREADRLGYAMLTRAGFDGRGASSMFGLMQNASRLNDNGSWPYLRTHPLTQERIADMDARAGGRGAALAPEWVPSLMAARARVLAAPGVDALRAATRAPGAPDFGRQPPLARAAALYAAALAHAQLREPERAQAHAETLLKLVAAQPAAAAQARLLLADVALRAGDGGRALAVLASSAAGAARRGAGPGTSAPGAASASAGPRRAPLNTRLPAEALRAMPGGASQAGRAETLLSAQAELRSGQPGAAAARLQGWIDGHPDDGGAWRLLASAAQASGQRLRALRAEGEAQAAELDWAGAVDRFRAAQDASRQRGAADRDEHIEASIIDTRLREAQQRLKAQQEAERKAG